MEIEKLDALTAKVTEDSKKEPPLPTSSSPSIKVKKSIKKRFVETFLKADIKDVKSYIFTDVIVPGIKDLAYNMITQGVNMWLFGDAKIKMKKNGDSWTSWTSYGAVSTKSGQSSTASKPVKSSRVEERGKPDKAEVLGIDSELREILSEYGKVFVAQYKSAFGLQVEPTDWNFGWTNLNDMYPYETRGEDENGRLVRVFALHMPKVEVLQQ